jgi:hypothetical protein
MCGHLGPSSSSSQRSASDGAPIRAPRVGQDDITFEFHVVAGKVIDGVWQATRIVGTMEANVTPNARGEANDCPTAFAHETVNRTRVGG